MSEHTKTPWEYSLETGELTSKHERGCEVVIEADGANPFDARHIVHCVNNHERLVEALREMESIASIAVRNEHYPFDDDYANYEATKEIDSARALLAELENQQ